MNQTEQATAPVFASPVAVTDPADCLFYHAIDLPGYGRIAGAWDFHDRPWRYLGEPEVAGKRVLEVGPANGFFTRLLEGAGAEVVAYDLSARDSWDAVPYAGADNASALAAHMAQIGRLNNAWWLTHRACGLKARLVHGSIYDMPAALGPFDVATVGAVLLHLRDPFLALQRIAAVTRETIVVTELVPFGHRPDWTGKETAVPAEMLADPWGPEMIFQPSAVEHDGFGTWWHLTPACVRRMLGVLGFEAERSTFHLQTHQGDYAHVFHTTVAHRVR